MDNYNSEVVGVPYCRFGEIEIYFGDSLSGNNISAVIKHYQAIRSQSGDVFPIGEGTTQQTFSLPKLTETAAWSAQNIPKRNYLTGEQIEVDGIPQFISLLDVLMAIYSASVMLKESA